MKYLLLFFEKVPIFINGFLLVQKNAENMYKKFVQIEHVGIDQTHGHHMAKCGLCGSISNSIQLRCRQVDIDIDKSSLEHDDSNTQKVLFCSCLYCYTVLDSYYF